MRKLSVPLIVSILFNLILVSYVAYNFNSKRTELVQSVASNCEQLAQNYGNLKKEEVKSIPSTSEKYSPQENAKYLNTHLRFQRIFTQILNLCQLDLADVAGYRQLTGDSTEMEK